MKRSERLAEIEKFWKSRERDFPWEVIEWHGNACDEGEKYQEQVNVEEKELQKNGYLISILDGTEFDVCWNEFLIERLQV